MIISPSYSLDLESLASLKINLVQKATEYLKLRQSTYVPRLVAELDVSKYAKPITNRDQSLIVKGEEIHDSFENIELEW